MPITILKKRIRNWLSSDFLLIKKIESMKVKLSYTKEIAGDNIVLIVDKSTALSDYDLTSEELNYVENVFENKQKIAEINRYTKRIYLYNSKADKEDYIRNEKARIAGAGLIGKLRNAKVESICIVDTISNSELTLAFGMGLALANYQFLKYFGTKIKKEKESPLKNISIHGVRPNQVEELRNIIEAVCKTRDLTNEPPNFQSAEQFALSMCEMGNKADFTTEIYDKKKIETLKMGGLLAVNKGSFNPPTFTVMEWKPEKAVNSQPVVLVGKGVVFDTGGLSLKSTKNSMDRMKNDMAGGAIVAGLMYAISKNKLPLHIIGLVPATDNRPGNHAFVPSDVLEMHDGTTVENLNSDAEGRLLLADGLSFAKRYNPKLVIDIATLTGSAAGATGKHASVVMGTATKDVFDTLKTSGFNTYERVVEFPLWDEYGEDIKSQIADIKNIGGATAGAITAGKFLEHFTNYPWIHVDIAGTAHYPKDEKYYTAGGSASGIRLFYDFFKTYFLES